VEEEEDGKLCGSARRRATRTMYTNLIYVISIYTHLKMTMTFIFFLETDLIFVNNRIHDKILPFCAVCKLLPFFVVYMF